MPGAQYLEIDRSAPTRPHILDTLIEDQEARKPQPTDAHPWLSRTLFVPFRDRALTITMQPKLGLKALWAGVLLPITKFAQQIIDYDAIKRVPIITMDGATPIFEPSEFGVTETKIVERAPGVVMEAIYRIFNAHHETDPQQDNGICEVEVLRGNEDMVLLREINAFLLPDAYRTARAQIAQLTKARQDPRAVSQPELCEEAATRLIASTEQSVVWSTWHYRRLRAQMKDKDRSGKHQLSPLDVAVCEWIEQPQPEFRGQLADETQRVVVQGAAPAAAPATPTIQHKRCGTFLNLVDGEPPEVCVVCNVPFLSEPDTGEAVALKCGDFDGETKAGAPCKQPAGQGTDHPGDGRCQLHEE